MTAVSLKVNMWLEKMSSVDKDFRFMAVNDLLTLLRKGAILDEDLELRVSDMLLHLLKDKNGEVQNIAIQCFPPLAELCRLKVVKHVAQSLLQILFGSDDARKDIATLTIKALLKEATMNIANAESMYKEIGTGVCQLLAQGPGEITAQLALDCLDILQVLLLNFTRYRQTAKDMEALFLKGAWPHLYHDRVAVKKRAVVAIGYLAPNCSESMLEKTVTRLMGIFGESSDIGLTRCAIQLLAAVGAQAGHRIGSYLPEFMTHLMQNEDSQPELLHDHILQTYEVLVRRCPRESTEYLPKIVSRCLSALKFDPNYNYDSDQEDEAMDDDEMGDDDDEEEYSDDDDVSWKIRRAAAKCLTAANATRPDMIVDLYTWSGEILISRFKEREENVKVDVLAAYTALLSSTKPLASGEDFNPDSSEMAIVLLHRQCGPLVKALSKEMKAKSPRTRQACFTLLTKLVQIFPGILSDHVGLIIPGIHFSLVDSKHAAGNIKTDSLVFLRTLLPSHNPEVFQKHILILMPPIIKAVNDPFYKIVSEALLVVQQLIPVVRSLEPMPAVVTEAVRTQFVFPAYRAILVRLKATDIDQEVKEHALMAMARLFHQFADCLEPEVRDCLPLYADRLRNEVTRVAAVKSLSVIAQSPLQIQLGANGDIILGLLSGFLRKTHRPLLLVSLAAANTLMQVYQDACRKELVALILENTFPLVTANDLHVSQLALILMTTIANTHSGAFADLNPGALRDLIKILQSPLVQGGVLQAFCGFLTAVSSSTSTNILPILAEFVNAPSTDGGLVMHKSCYGSFAMCSASLVSINPSIVQATVQELVMSIQNEAASDSLRLYSLLTLGEIGRQNDLQSVDIQVILNCFKAPSEDLKTAASLCFGLVSAGNPGHFFPLVLEQISSRSKHQYLLLHALRELISALSTSEAGMSRMEPFVDQIWSLLFAHCESTEEGTRNMVAECLGKLTLVDPARRLPILQAELDGATSSAVLRATVITAVRFTVSEQEQAVDGQLRDRISQFLQRLEDDDVNVRRVTLLLLNSVAHNKPALITDLLPSILPRLYNETQIRKELIREVEMGPFKHTVDDGLDIRKAAFECMYTFLEKCLEKLDIFIFLSHVENGIKDHYDIKMLTHLMLIRLSELTPAALLQRLGNLVESLRSTVTQKAKANAVKQELEKQDELKRSALRCLVALRSLPDSEKSSQLTDFLLMLKSNAELLVMFDAVQKERDIKTASADGNKS